MLDFKAVYDNSSKKEQKVLKTITGNTLDVLNVTIWLNSLSQKDLEIIQDIVDLYKSIEQNKGFIEILDKACLRKVM